jgi:hypothetical protein
MTQDDRQRGKKPHDVEIVLRRIAQDIRKSAPGSGDWRLGILPTRLQQGGHWESSVNLAPAGQWRA